MKEEIGTEMRVCLPGCSAGQGQSQGYKPQPILLTTPASGEETLNDGHKASVLVWGGEVAGGSLLTL